MENMYVQFVKKQSMHGVVTMKTLQTLQISFAIIVFQINTINQSYYSCFTLEESWFGSLEHVQDEGYCFAEAHGFKFLSTFVVCHLG